MAVPGTPPRSMVIDRRRHRRIVRDLVLATAGARSGQWWAGALLAGIVLFSVTRQLWYAGLALGFAFVGLQLQVWWVGAKRAARDGLAVGQKVTMAYETPLWGFLVLGGGLFTITGVPGLIGIRRWRAAFRRGFPVGWTLHAQVTPDRLSVTWPHATRAFPWGSFDRVTATEHNLLLRHRRQRFGSFVATVLPLDLFRPEDIRLMASVVAGPR